MSTACMHLAFGKAVLEQHREPRDGDARERGRVEDGDAGGVVGGHHLRRRRCRAGAEQAGHTAREGPGGNRRALGGRVTLEEPHLALADDEDAARVEVLVVARKREAGLLDVRAGDGPFEPGARRRAHSSLRPSASARLPSSTATVTGGVSDIRGGRQRSGSISPRSPFLRR